MSFLYFTISWGNNHVSGSTIPTLMLSYEPVIALLYLPSDIVVLVGSIRTLRRLAKSRADIDIGPSALNETGTRLSCGISLIVGLMVYKADLSAGIMREPVVSVLIEMAQKPAVMATVEPEEKLLGRILSRTETTARNFVVLGLFLYCVLYPYYYRENPLEYEQVVFSSHRRPAEFCKIGSWYKFIDFSLLK